MGETNIVRERLDMATTSSRKKGALTPISVASPVVTSTTTRSFQKFVSTLLVCPYNVFVKKSKAKHRNRTGSPDTTSVTTPTRCELPLCKSRTFKELDVASLAIPYNGKRSKYRLGADVTVGAADIDGTRVGESVEDGWTLGRELGTNSVEASVDANATAVNENRPVVKFPTAL